MKRTFSILGQTLLLLLTAVGGMLARPFHVTRVIALQGVERRQYEFDWLISVGIVALLFLLVGVLSRRIRTSWVSTAVAFALTVLIVVLFTKIGYRDVNLLYGDR